MREYTPWQIEEIERCANDFIYFARTYVKITHPNKGLIPFNLYDYQKRVIGCFESHKFNIVSKFRQGGLTTVTVIWCLWRCLFMTDQRIMTVSIGDREAISAGKIVSNVIDNLPDWMKPEMKKNNDHEKDFIDTNSFMWFLSPKAARSMSLTYLIIDEAAFINKMEDLWKGMYPTLSTGGNCIVISTVNGLGNWYQETFYNARDKRNLFHVIEIEYTEHPDYRDPDWVKKTRMQLGERGWKQEVLRQFLGTGNTYIDSEKIGELLDSTKNNEPKDVLFAEWESQREGIDEAVVNTNYVGGALWIWEHPKYNTEYIIAADCAEGIGQGGDNSAFQVIDVMNCTQVAEFYSNTIPPNAFAQVLCEFSHYYNNALLVVEQAGPGMAVLNKLEHQLFYENLYFHTEDRPGIRMGPNNRPVILESLQSAIHHKSVTINSRRLVEELNTFIYHKGKKRAEAQKGKHDDLIISLATALFIRDEHTRNVPITTDKSINQELTAVFASDLFEKIKLEIQNAAPEDWLANRLNYIDKSDKKETVPGVMFDIKPKNYRILQEFGWF